MFKKLILAGLLAAQPLSAIADSLKSTFIVVGPRADWALVPSTPDAERNREYWSAWKKSDFDKFSNDVNAYIISPVNVDDYASLDITTSKWTENFPGYDQYNNFSFYLLDVRNTVAELAKSKPNAKVYIGIPHFIENGVRVPSNQSDFEIAMGRFVRDTRAQINTTVSQQAGISNYFDSNVAGFYLSDEKFDGCVDTSQPTTLCTTLIDGGSHTRHFDYFKAARTQIGYNAPGKELIWSPHSGVEDYNPSVQSGLESPRISWVMNWQNQNGTLFEHILMQPGYTNQHCGLPNVGDCGRNIFDRVRDQKLYSVAAPNGVSYYGTKLGVNMEVDPNSSRYAEYYPQTFAPLGSSKSFTFWIGQRVNAENGDYYNLVNSFYSGL